MEWNEESAPSISEGNIVISALLHCELCCKLVLHLFFLYPSNLHQIVHQAFGMPSTHLLILTTLFVALMVVLTSGARTTGWPKPRSTNKPPRAGSSWGGGFGRTTTTTPSPANSLQTEETTEFVDAYTMSSTDSSTYHSDTYPTEFPIDAIAPPGNTLGNYTLDYNECFFNFCECCPPTRGPTGPMGEIGPPGPPGPMGLSGKMKCFFQDNYFMEIKILFLSSSFCVFKAY